MSLSNGLLNLTSWLGNVIMPTMAGLFAAAAIYRFSKGHPYSHLGYAALASLMCSGLLRAMEFAHLLQNVISHRYGIEIDANRAEQARALGIETVLANAMDVRCPPEAVSLLYLNPPYDWESGESNNQRLELVFLRTHLSLAQSWWCAGIRHPPTAIGEMCEIAKRTFNRLARVPTHRTCLPAIPTNRSPCDPSQTTCPGH
ncbi:MAG: hypothetical protein WA474_00525 [Candidatus Sulfotelmatobacter sp.]